MGKRFKQTVVALLVLSMSLFGLPSLGIAAPIGTETLVQLDQRDQLLSDIQARLARDEVRAEFLARGVSPAEVDERVAALSTEELRQLRQQIDELPAGGILAVIGVVFVVLLILEMVGVTNVFTKV